MSDLCTAITGSDVIITLVRLRTRSLTEALGVKHDGGPVTFINAADYDLSTYDDG